MQDENPPPETEEPNETDTPDGNVTGEETNRSKETKTKQEVTFYGTSENFPLEDDAHIPYEYWRPVFGGEALERKLWDKILQKEGEFVIIKGSGVLALIMGGYEINPNTGLAIAEKRADIDIDIPQHLPEVLERAKQLSHSSGNVAHKAIVADVNVDFVDEKKVRKQLLHSFMDTEYSITLELTRVRTPYAGFIYRDAIDPDTGLTIAENQAYNDALRKIELRRTETTQYLIHLYKLVRSARETSFGIENNPISGWSEDPIKNTRDVLENAYQRDGWIQLQRRYMPHAEIIDNPSKTYKTTLIANAFSKLESVAIKLERKDGKLVATLQDPGYILQRWEGPTPSIEQQRNIYHEQGLQPQLFTKNQMDSSAFAQTIMVAQAVEQLRYREMGAAFYPASALGRLMRNACERGIEINADPSYNMGSQAYYDEIFGFAYRLATEDDMLRIVDESGNPDKEKEKELKELTHERLQREFARAAFFDPTKASCYMLAYLPLGNYLSTDLAQTFAEYHEKFRPNNSMIERLLYAGNFENMMKPGHETPKSIEDIPEGLDFIIRSILLGYALYPDSSVDSISPTVGDTEKTNKVKYFYKKDPPKNASEVLAFVATCAKWDPDTHREQIEEMIANWKPSGDFTAHWGINQETRFSFNVDFETVVAEMCRMKPILDEIEAQEVERLSKKD